MGKRWNSSSATGSMVVAPGEKARQLSGDFMSIERDGRYRLILAAARTVSARLVSADESLDGHGVERVWE